MPRIAAYRQKPMHLNEARELLRNKEECDIRVFKMSTGEPITYKDVVCTGWDIRKGVHRIKLPNGQRRTFRDIMLISYNGHSIFL